MQAIIKKSDGEHTTTLEQKPNLVIIDEIDGASSAGGGEVGGFTNGLDNECINNGH